jgi:hypothetical protein
MTYDIRKWISRVEEIRHDGGETGEPLIKAAVGVVFRNPFAGAYIADLSDLVRPSAELGTALGQRAVALLNGRPVASYGKAGIAGTDGEQEHVVACVTSVFGDALRSAVGGGDAWISSVTKVAAAGTSIDIPLAHKDALYVRSHYDGITLADDDSPRRGELMVCVAVASGPRVHERSGGITPAEIRGGGLR